MDMKRKEGSSTFPLSCQLSFLATRPTKVTLCTFTPIQTCMHAKKKKGKAMKSDGWMKVEAITSQLNRDNKRAVNKRTNIPWKIFAYLHKYNEFISCHRNIFNSLSSLYICGRKTNTSFTSEKINSNHF